MAANDVPEEKDKPVYDEQPLARLLEAAYVLQEQNRKLQKLELNLELQRDHLGSQEQGVPTPLPQAPRSQATEPALKEDYTLTLAQIVETQRQIQARNLQFEDALALVAERVTEIANAGGAAIGIAQDKQVYYRAVAGAMTLPVGTGLSMEKALCVACMRTGQVIRCADVNSEFLLDVEECQRRGIQSMIAVPVYHDGGMAGGLELYYGTTQAFSEQDVHTCQLMAGLVTEALARDEEAARKKSLASERAMMLDALEKLKPNLAALMDVPAGTPMKASSSATNAAAFLCRKCGHQLMGEEQFCGNCGTPRSGDYEPPTMQSKVATLWHMQEAMKKDAASLPANGETAHEDTASISGTDSSDNLAGLPAKSTELREPDLRTPELDHRMPESIDASEIHAMSQADAPGMAMSTEALPENLSDERASSEETALVPPEQAWASAASARDFLEQLAAGKPSGFLARLWNTRRGDIYLGIAVILVAVVIRWGIWSDHSVNATGNTPAAHRKAAPDADLSMFDRMLISLGLAEAPPPLSESKGNPDAQVWVDLHTALYYCPGSDLYGKTPKGKYTSQRDAQLDQFGPAYGKACD